MYVSTYISDHFIFFLHKNLLNLPIKLKRLDKKGRRLIASVLKRYFLFIRTGSIGLSAFSSGAFRQYREKRRSGYA